MTVKKKILSRKKTAGKSQSVKKSPGTGRNANLTIADSNVAVSPEDILSPEEKKKLKQFSPNSTVLTSTDTGMVAATIITPVKQTLEIDYFLPYQLAWINDPYQI